MKWATIRWATARYSDGEGEDKPGEGTCRLVGLRILDEVTFPGASGAYDSVACARSQVCLCG